MAPTPVRLRSRLGRLALPSVVFFYAAGLAVLAHGMSRLRWAHLYRQRFDEGLGFFWVGVELFAVSALLSAVAIALYLAGLRRGGRSRIALMAASMAVPFLLVTCAALAVWVEARGDRCIGPCG